MNTPITLTKAEEQVMKHCRVIFADPDEFRQLLRAIRNEALDEAADADARFHLSSLKQETCSYNAILSLKGEE